MAETRHLALKWRDADQLGCVFGETTRLPVADGALLDSALGQICTIYIPRRGALSSGLPDMAHVAVTRPVRIMEHSGAATLIVLLSGTQLLPFPVRQRSDQPIEDTLGHFPPRDRSAEQLAVRQLSRIMLAEMLRNSGARSHRTELNVLHQRGLQEPDQPQLRHQAISGIGSEAMNAAYPREAVTRTMRDRRLRRLAIEADDGRCVVTGWQRRFRGRLVGVQAAHFRSLESRGV